MDDIARFGAHLSNEKHASQNTVSSYLRDTTQFAEYLHNYCDIDLREADSAAVQDYMDWMLSHGKRIAVWFEIIWSGCRGGANPPRPLPGFWLPSNPFTAT